MNELVSLFLAVDRAQGDVSEFIGFSKAELEGVGQWDELQTKLKALDDAMAALQVKVYDIAGVK